jgi:uncharacterized membrane protein
MLQTYITILFALVFPFFILRAEKKSRAVKWISPIIICYLVGMLLGNLPWLSLDRDLMGYSSMGSVILAIPLLLFSAYLPALLKQVKPALFAYFLGVVSVVVCASFAYWIFRERISDVHNASGMIVGVYTGGIQNMAAIGTGLGVEEEVFLILNSADIVYTGLYFFFLLSVAKRVVGKVLPVKISPIKGSDTSKSDGNHLESKGKLLQVFMGLVFALLIVGIAVGISLLIVESFENALPLIILLISALGIAASFIRRIRFLPGTFSTANYLLLVFAVAMGSMANFSELIEASSALFWFCGFVAFGSILLHFLFAILFRVDRDILIISQTAAIYGAPFIPPVAQAIGNKDLITIGISLSLIGYAIGNFLGLSLAYILG